MLVFIYYFAPFCYYFIPIEVMICFIINDIREYRRKYK